MMLLYWNLPRKGSVGSKWASRAKTSLPVSRVLYQNRSWRGRPERCVTRSRGVIDSVAIGSLIRRPGR